MCILRFHARAGYLQHYETLLKELNEHPASDPVPDQYEVECAALSDRNLNVPCESGLRFPSYMVMLQRRQTQSRISVNFCLVHVHTVLYCVCTCSHMIHTCMYMYMHLTQCAWQAKSKQSTGCVSLDINLLKPSRIEFAGDPAPSLSLPDGPFSHPKWLDYVYRTANPVLRWLPTKLAEWIGENLQAELGFPDKADQRAEPGSGWTPAELNHILHAHVVDGALTTFGCVEWESDLCRGVMRARCYPFNLPKHRFHGMNPKVLYIHYSNMYIHSTYIYKLLHT
jgi:hypothetical protein